MTMTADEFSEMEIRCAIGFKERCATEILMKFPKKNYVWIKKHLDRMIEKGLIIRVGERKGRVYYKVDQI